MLANYYAAMVHDHWNSGGVYCMASSKLWVFPLLAACVCVRARALACACACACACVVLTAGDFSFLLSFKALMDFTVKKTTHRLNKISCLSLRIMFLLLF